MVFCRLTDDIHDRETNARRERGDVAVRLSDVDEVQRHRDARPGRHLPAGDGRPSERGRRERAFHLLRHRLPDVVLRHAVIRRLDEP